MSFAANFLDCESNRYLLPVVQKIAPRAILGLGSSDNNDKCRNDLLPPSGMDGKYGKLKMAPLPCSNIIWTLTMNASILIPVSSLFTHDVLLVELATKVHPKVRNHGEGPSPS